MNVSGCSSIGVLNQVKMNKWSADIDQYLGEWRRNHPLSPSTFYNRHVRFMAWDVFLFLFFAGGKFKCWVKEHADLLTEHADISRLLFWNSPNGEKNMTHQHAGPHRQRLNKQGNRQLSVPGSLNGCLYGGKRPDHGFCIQVGFVANFVASLDSSHMF